MAVTIVNVSDLIYSIDGIEYEKNYQSVVFGDLVEVSNVYDSRDVRVKRTIYSDYTVNGTIYVSATLLQSALIGVLFTSYQQAFDSRLDDNEARIDNLEQNQVTGVHVYETLASLPVTGTLLISYKVSNDTPSSNNGYYHWNGAVYIKDATLANGVIESGDVDPISGNTVYEYAPSKSNFTIPHLKFIDNLASITPNAQIFPNPNSWTFEIFCKINDVVTVQAVVRDGGGAAPFLSINGSKLQVGESGVAVNAEVSLIGLQDKDLFIQLTYNGTIHRCFINNIEVAVTVINIQPYTASSGAVLIGSYVDGVQSMNVDLNLLRIYSRVLSDAEMTTSYNNELPHIFITEKETDLTLELLADNLNGDSWVDTSINQSVGSVSNSIEQTSNILNVNKITGGVDTEVVKFNNGISVFQSENNIFPNADFSVEMFIKFNDITTTASIFTPTLSSAVACTLLANKLAVSVSGVTNTLEFSTVGMLGVFKHIIISYIGGVHTVYVDGAEYSSTLLSGTPYATGVSGINLGAFALSTLPINADFNLFRIWSKGVDGIEALDLFNNGKPNNKRVEKTDDITLELYGNNSNSQSWYDTSDFQAKGAISGDVTTNAILPNTAGNASNLSSLLDSIPSNIYIAVDREFNLWFDSLLPYYAKQDYLVECTCSEGKTMDRSYRFKPTGTGVFALTILIKDLNNILITSKTVNLNAVSKTAGVGTTQILAIGDSTTDSYLTDYLGTGRIKYEMLVELNSLFTTDGGASPLLIGTNGVAPINHEGRSGYSSDLFITNNISFPNPFWDVGNARNDFQKYMLDNANFGGTNTIDFVPIQLGINDLKNGGDASIVISRLTTLINDIHHITRGYPNAKIIISATPYTSSDRTGWAEHFFADQEYTDFVKAMNNLAQLVVATFHENVSFPNVYVSPTMLMVDRKYGYPRALIDVSDRSTIQEYQGTDSVHPDTSGYHQAADAYYSRLRSLL